MASAPHRDQGAPALDEFEPADWRGRTQARASREQAPNAVPMGNNWATSPTEISRDRRPGLGVKPEN